ncbi:MAG TPA: hypothetical protein DCZ05_15630 [Deltaproteobacteria bacterium]|nr:hypothetical protein [Deltaproteobacteria bacterium]
MCKVTKVSKKGRSSVPLEDDTDSPFRESLREWLMWLRSGGESPWAVYRISLKQGFFEWAEQTANRADDALRELYYRYKILPSRVLTRLVMHKIGSLSRDEVFSGKWIDRPTGWIQKSREDMSAVEFGAKLRSRKTREEDARALEKAAEVLTTWKPYFAPLTWSPFPDPERLKKFAQSLRELGPAQRHRPQEAKRKACAQDLAALFKKQTQNPLYRYVGELTLAAFPGSCDPAWDFREAGKKLVKRGISAKDDIWIPYGGFFPWGGYTLQDLLRPDPRDWFNTSRGD